MIPEHKAASLKIHSGPGVHCLTGSAALEAAPRADFNILGVGAAFLAASAVAVTYGRDAALLRHKPKDHGTGRQIDGVFDPALPAAVYVSSDADQKLAIALGVNVAEWIYVPLGSPWPSMPDTESVATRSAVPATDLLGAARLLTGRSFMRSSGQTADYYFETLEAAFRYDVATAFAGRLTESGPWDAVAGVRWGGAFLAITLALRANLPKFLIKPNAAFQPCKVPGLSGSVLLVDDLVNTAQSLVSCERLIRQQEGVRDVSLAVLFAISGGGFGCRSYIMPPIELHGP